MSHELFGFKPKKEQVKEKEQNAFQNKLETEQMKQEIFNQIRTVVDEYGGTEKWGSDVEKLLKVDILKTFTNSAGIEFVLVPAGEFMMGSNNFCHEMPVHKVTIGYPFYLGKYPVTQKQWQTVIGSNPSRFEGDDLPVEKVSWNDIQEFINKLNQTEGKNKYRLPSEAEWEYACRAGTTSSYSFGDDESKLRDFAWFYDNSDSKTHPVGQKEPNPRDLYDMHGNVWEWVQDNYHDNYNGAPSNGSAWEDESNSYRVYRGGGWSNLSELCRSASRDRFVPDFRFAYLGFRLLRTL